MAAAILWTGCSQEKAYPGEESASAQPQPSQGLRALTLRSSKPALQWTAAPPTPGPASPKEPEKRNNPETRESGLTNKPETALNVEPPPPQAVKILQEELGPPVKLMSVADLDPIS